MINGELIVDNFAGGGGASTGIELATGYSVDIAINHDPEAIKMHKANHPNTKHYCENVWAVDPVKACNGPMGILSDLPGSRRTASTFQRQKVASQRIRTSEDLHG